VFKFISTHWRPAPPANPVTGTKPGSGIEQATKDAEGCDDVEMIEDGPQNEHAHACTGRNATPVTGAEAADASKRQEQENTPENVKEGDVEDGMEVDGESEGAKDEKESSGKEDSMKIDDDDDDDDVIIATSSGDGPVGANAGQVLIRKSNVYVWFCRFSTEFSATSF
jgi:hypothetical protein